MCRRWLGCGGSLSTVSVPFFSEKNRRTRGKPGLWIAAATSQAAMNYAKPRRTVTRRAKQGLPAGLHTMARRGIQHAPFKNTRTGQEFFETKEPVASGLVQAGLWA